MYFVIKFIQTIHLLLIFFILFAPFSKNKKIIELHLFIIPILIFHWITNNNMCSLTVIEKVLSRNTGYHENEFFISKIINPVFDFSKNYEKLSIIIYLVTITLWIISLKKYYSLKN